MVEKVGLTVGEAKMANWPIENGRVAYRIKVASRPH